MINTDWLAGTIGLEWYLGLTPLNLTRTQVKQSLRAEEYVKTRAKSWVAARKPSKLIPGKLPLSGYDMVVTALHNPLHSPPDISGLEGELVITLLTKYMEIGFYLQKQLPTTKLSSGFIAREVTPAISDQTRFMWSCNAINDVRIIFDMLDAGALTKIEADAFKELFPDLALFTATTYLEESINFLYSSQAPTLTSWQALGLSALMGAPISDFSDVMTWQAGYNGPSGPGRPPSKAPDLASANATDTQRKDIPR